MKKLLSSLLIAALFFNAGVLSVFAYDDVPSGSQYFYSIEYLRRNDVFQETKYFKPDVIINRAEFIKYLVTLNSPDFKPTTTAKLPYEDTRDNAWYASYFKEAIDLGILEENLKKAEPYKTLTLLDALTLLFHSQSIPIPNRFVGGIPYTDVERNKQAAPLIMRALNLGIIEPDRPDYVGIYKRVNRAEAARMIYRMDLVNLASSNPSPTLTYSVGLQKIINAWELITSDYIGRDEVDQTALSDAALRAMLKELEDPYSTYYDPEENNLAFDDLNGEIEGIGAFIGLEDDGSIAIIAPISESPAEKAGVKSGDIITHVNDTSLEGMTLEKAVSMIKGPKGTEVKLGIKRGTRSLTISVTRNVVKIVSLEYEVQGQNMIIKMSQFNHTTFREFREAANAIQSNPRIKGILIDVRDNPGGLLDTVVRILGLLLLPESEVLTIEYSTFSHTQYNQDDGELAKYPMVVLVNKGSASASEILAGALKDFGLATIVGETTFGKGTVQEINYFGDGSSLKLTVARWLTPLGNSIQANGITPNIIVSNPEDSSQDVQMERALIELNRLIDAR